MEMPALLVRAHETDTVGLGPTAGAVITVIITGALALRAPRLVHRARSPGDHLWLISVVHLAAA